MSVRRFLRDLLGAGLPRAVGDDLLALGAAAVMGRALSLGDLLVLPSHVVFTLPAAEVELFRSPRLRETLARSVEQAVHQRSAEYLRRLQDVHGRRLTVIGGEDLRISLVEGDVREVDARFESRRAGSADAVDVTVCDDRTVPFGGPGDDVTRVDGDLALVLHSDGVPLRALRPGDGPLRVGRDPGCELVVPQDKQSVSREAAVVTRCTAGAVDLQVVNRNGAWLAGGPGSPRLHVVAGRCVRVRPGERVDLDQAASVALVVTALVVTGGLASEGRAGG